MISATMLTGYEYCARKLYLQYVLKLVEPPKEALVKGSIRHEVHEKINKNEEELVKSVDKKLSFEDLFSVFRSSYSNILRNTIIESKDKLKQFNIMPKELFKNVWPLILTESRTRSNNVFSFIQKTGLLGNELWGALTPKIESEIRIESLKLNLKGIVDKVEKHNNGLLVPVELKTGKMPDKGVWPGHKIQLGAYTLLLEDKFNVKINEGYVHYLDAEEKRTIFVNPFLKDEVIGLISKVQALMDSDKIPKICANTNKCSSCGLKERCHNEKF